MSGASDRILVTSGRVEVDPDALVESARRLRSAADALAAAEIFTRRAVDDASEAVVSDPFGPRSALEGALEAGHAVERARVVLADLADSVVFAAALYADAEGRAALLGRFDPFAPLDLDLSLDAGGPRGDRRGFDPLGDLMEGVGLFGRRVDLLAEILSFLTGRGGGLAGPRMEGDLASMSRDLVESARLDADGMRGTAGLGAKGAAGLAARWAAALGVLVSGRAVGVEITTGAGVPAGRAHRVVDAVAEEEGAILLPDRRVPSVFALLSLLARGARGIPLPLGSASALLPRLLDARSDPTPARVRETPREPSVLLGELAGLRSGGDEGQLTILRHETPLPDGTSTRSWSVVIRGTQKWGAGGSNPQDMLSNLEGVADTDSDQNCAVLAAMEMAGIGAGEPVEFVGHSQGGIVAANLATDPRVGEDYAVVSALTAGSPIASSAPPEGVRVLALENTRDLVPALDGAPNPEGVVTVLFDGADLVPVDERRSPFSAHGIGTYRNLLEEVEGGAARADPALAEIAEWEEARAERMGFSSSTRTSAFVFDTRRIRGPSGGGLPVVP